MIKKKIQILRSILGDSYRSRDEYLFYCPKCEHHKKKLSINIVKNKFKCWICDYKGNSVHRLIRRWGNFNQQQQWSELTSDFNIGVFETLFKPELLIEEKQKIDLPKEFQTLATTNGSVGSLPVRKYLNSRGVSKNDILKWKIGYCFFGEYEGRVVVPSFNLDGNVDYFVARSYNSDWRKYLNPPVSKNIIFNELYIDWSSDLSIVEGVFDAIIAENSVPILGSTLSEKHKLFNKIIENDTPIYIALDPDAEAKTLRLIKKLIEYDVEVYKVNIHPYSDVAEMSKKEYQDRKKLATLMDPQSFLDYTIASI
jgi:DNA primase|tara:strand:- start:457 stop:1389 length:933 start_codon:yes stop_codon:yes gene_type:complete